MGLEFFKNLSSEDLNNRDPCYMLTSPGVLNL